jgi:hypothetical protein
MEEFKKENPDTVQLKKCKKALSAYIIYCNTRRSSLIQENPDLRPKDVISALAEEWNKVKADGGAEFKKFQELAENDKVRYQNEKAEEDSTRKEDGSDVEEKPKKKAKKTTEKKPAAAKKTSKKKEALDVVEEEDIEEEKPVKKTAKKVDGGDKKEPAEKKEPAAKKAKVEKKKPSKEEDDVVSDEPKAEKKKTGYVKYLAANRDGFKKANAALESKQVTSQLAAQWRSLSDEEKKQWTDA